MPEVPPVQGATMRVVCSYCLAVIVEGDKGAPVSHGACDACFRRELAAIDALAEATQSRAEAYA